jgi:hypothetical protein
MPLAANVTELNSSNTVQLMLPALQSNDVVKALVFMPGATDELYFFHRVRARLPNRAASLLDAVDALQTQTRIRATFHAPLLLLHSDEDQLQPVIEAESASLIEKIRAAKFVAHGVYIDRDWDYMQPIIRKSLKVEVLPARYSSGSWHFYRHSFAAWNLNGWEALEAIVFAGKTKCSIQKQGGLSLRRTLVTFEQDRRVAAKR